MFEASETYKTEISMTAFWLRGALFVEHKPSLISHCCISHLNHDWELVIGLARRLTPPDHT